MKSSSQLRDAFEIRIHQKIAELEAQLSSHVSPSRVQKRNADADFEDSFQLQRAHITTLRDILELLSRSPDVRLILGELIGQQILETERHLIQQLEQQAMDMAQQEIKRDRQQRRENILISITSLVSGWLLSLVGTPAMFFTHFWR